MFFAALFGFLAAIALVAYPVYYCHRYRMNQLDEEWRNLLQNRFAQIPTSYHDAFEKGWEACKNSESTVRLQYQKFFGQVG